MDENNRTDLIEDTEIKEEEEEDYEDVEVTELLEHLKEEDEEMDQDDGEETNLEDSDYAEDNEQAEEPLQATATPILKRDLVPCLRGGESNLILGVKFILKCMGSPESTENNKKARNILIQLGDKYYAKWNESNGLKETFEKNNKDWLDSLAVVPAAMHKVPPASTTLDASRTKNNSTGLRNNPMKRNSQNEASSSNVQTEAIPRVYVESNIRKRDLLPYMKGGETSMAAGVKYLLKRLKSPITAETRTEAFKLVSSWRRHFDERRKATHYSATRFEMKYKKWLDSNINIPSFLMPSPSESSIVGLPFKTNRQQTDSLTITKSLAIDDPVTLILAASGMAQGKGEVIVAQILNEVGQVLKSPTVPTTPLVLATSQLARERGDINLADALSEAVRVNDRPTTVLANDERQHPFTPIEANSLLRDLQLTATQYVKLREAIVAKGYINIFPPYHQLLQSSKKL